MQYLRVVFAVNEENMKVFKEIILDSFIEECELIDGAYISNSYSTREEAIGLEVLKDFKELNHRPDCQLITVTTYGLCTCDFDKRCEEAIGKDFKEA